MMTVFDIHTNDDWYAVFVLGTQFPETLYATYFFCYTLVFFVNYMTFGVSIAILIDGFSKLKSEHENIDVEDDKSFSTQISLKMLNLLGVDSNSNPENESNPESL